LNATVAVDPLAAPASAAGPLAGIGVVVTRPARQAAGLAAKLAALGATPVVFPAIVILPPADRAALEAAHAALHECDFAFFVSANAAEYGAPAQWPSNVVAFAPGPGTAEALVACGVPDVRVPASTQDSEGLLALPELGDVKGKRAVVFRGEGGRELLADSLRARGAQVDCVTCYRRAAPSTGAQGLVDVLRDGRAHALTVTSSEGLDNVWQVLGDEGRALARRLPCFAPHPRIVAHGRTLGLDMRATDSGDAGLLAALLAWAPRSAS
jgi:uroporphyrinogen-III synthase